MVFKKGDIPWNKGKKTKPHTQEWRDNHSNMMKGITTWNKGLKLSPEHCRNLSIAKIGNKNRLGIPHTEKTKKQIGESSKGRTPTNKGIPMAKEIKEKIKKKLIGRIFTDEHRRNLSIAGMGRELTPEHRTNLSKAQLVFLKEHPEFLIENSKKMKGKPSPMKGKHHTDETKQILRELAIKQFKDPKMRELFKINRRKIIVPVKDSKPEIMLQIALSLHKISFEKHKPLIGQPDIFIKPNICIFVDGDYWHANPNKYDSEKKIFGKFQAKDIWAKDLRIIHELNQSGYQVIRIWESDIKKNVNDCAINIIKLIESLRRVAN